MNIPSPPWKKLGRKMESQVRKALFDFHMLQNRKKIGVALSGGKDSLTLLFLLKAISGKGFPEIDLTAIHVSGAFSCGASLQLNYLNRICNEINVPLVTLNTKQTLETLECYSCSRERRRLIFDAALKNGIGTIAFGHHRDDSAQTLLMNLLHKGEFASMLPQIEMVNYGITIIRPLIYVSEKEIINFAKEHGFCKVTCQCPVGQNSMRKKIDSLLTNLEEDFPNVRQNIAQSALTYGSQKARK